MKKRIVLVVAIIALAATLATVLCACNVDQEVDLDSFTASEALTSVVKYVWNDDVLTASDWERTGDVEPSTYDNGSETEAYHALNFEFNKDKYGLEFGVLQFDIIADRDVEGYWLLHFYVEGGGFDVNKRVNYSLIAGEKKTITIDFENNFMFKRNVEYAFLDISFKTDFHEGGASWKEWAKTKYTISNWEIALND